MDVSNDEDGFEHDGDGQWPFHTFVEQLIIDMFDSGKHFTRYHILYNLEKECGIVGFTSFYFRVNYTDNP